MVPLDNTYLKQIMPMAQKSSLVRHAILALASSYVLDWYFNQQIEMRATHHYQQTVKLLGQELGDGENQEPDHGEPLIATLILLCHNEVSIEN